MSKNSTNPPNSPHAKAANTYDQYAKNQTPDQRELEARILLKSANQLQSLQANWDSVTSAQIDEALTYNRQIWMMFVDTAIENKEEGHSIELRNNIVNLGAFIFKRTVDILLDSKKEKLDILIEINRGIAAGLMTKPAK